MVQRTGSITRKKQTVKRPAGAVSLVSLFALVYRSLETLLEGRETPEQFFPYMDRFVHERLRNRLHRSIFRYVLRRLKAMDFESARLECAEVPRRIAEKDREVWDLIIRYEISHLTA